MPKIIKIKTKSNEYNVVIKKDIINNLSEYIDTKKHVFIITDTNVANYYLDTVLKQFLSADSFIISAGEANKNINTIMSIVEKLSEVKADKDTLIIALGGGVVGDISGLVASLYHRGIDYISIPTSTLAQVDSSVGGKVAINVKKSKNLIGTFYPPSLVLIDINILKTLEKIHYYSGLVEATKMGITSNKYLFELILNNDIENNLEEIIYEAIKTKAMIVIEDEHDNNLRNILNYGHTLGHALEMYYNLIHGQAILLGMYYSSNDYIRSYLEKIANKFNISLEISLNNKLYEIMLNDKKIKNNEINLVEVLEIGEGYLKKYPITYLKELLDE